MADVSCSRIQFQAGDRVLVRSYRPLDADAQRKLRRTIRRWAGCDVEVLVYDAAVMDVTVEKGLHV